MSERDCFAFQELCNEKGTLQMEHRFAVADSPCSNGTRVSG